jgi:hypothetical protein
MSTSVDLSNVSLSGIASGAQAAIESADTALSSMMGNLGPNATAGQLVEFQMALAKSSIQAATWSALAKERSDVLKGVVQKF